MKLYLIRDWDAQFENNRSRTVKELAWVAIPNRHDGENYTAVITSKDGAEIFSAWVLMVQVASRCQSRGTLLRGNGTPHDSASLSVKTRAPKSWFDKAFKFLTENTDWLEVKEVAVGCQEADGLLPLDCQSGDEEQKGTEVNGMGQKPKGVFEKTDVFIRIESLFRRKLITEPSDGEVKAFKKIGVIDPDDLSLIERYYRAEIKDQDYRRRDLQTLLNNWKGEVDRARNFKFPSESNGGF